MNTSDLGYPNSNIDERMIQKAKGDLEADLTETQTLESGFNHWIEVQIYPRNLNLRTFTPHLIQKSLTTH
ncbi:MAG: hypothetical protein WCO85_07825 [Actinomycetes bacterium]